MLSERPVQLTDRIGPGVRTEIFFFFTENCEEKFFLGGYDSPLEEKIFFPVFHPKLVGFHFFTIVGTIKKKI